MKNLIQQLGGSRFIKDGPGDGRGFEDRLPDGVRLFGLALQLQPARLPLPVLLRRLPGLDLHLACDGQSQQPEKGMGGVGFDEIHMFDGPRQRHIQRIDEELVDLHRFVAFVLRAAVFERIRRQILRPHALCDVGESRSVPRNEAVQDGMLVFQTLGLVNRKQQRGAEVFAGIELVFVPHHEHGAPRGVAGFLVEFLFDGVLVGQQGHPAARRLIDRARTRKFSHV